MPLYRIRLVCETGPEPLTGEILEASEEVLEVEAATRWNAFRRAPVHMTIVPSGRLLRGYDADTGEEILPPPQRVFRRGRFVIADVQGPYDGYTNGETWNGWAVPYFEHAEARRVVDDYVRVNQEADGDMTGSRARYDRHEDAFFLYDPIWDEEVACHGVEIEVDRRTLTAYPIGSAEWAWEEVRR